MRIKILIDMNLSPDWVPLLENAGWSATHWSTVGDPRATDRSIMDWAESNGYVVFTHDPDFGTLLALTHKTGPSVLQVRGEDVLPNHMGNLVLTALRQHEAELASGTLLVVEERIACACYRFSSLCVLIRDIAALLGTTSSPLSPSKSIL